MHNTTGGDSFTPFKQSLIVRLILLPFGLIFRLWTRSIRFDYAEENGLEELGINSWEGLDPKERRDSLQDEDKARVVYYDSCRGLEGWAVICRKFDIYWNSLLKVASENKKLEEPLTFFPDDYIKRSDVRQPVIDHVLIPFTRATNTLVLEISSKETFIGSTLHKMSIDPSTRDIIEWRDPDKLAEDEIPY